MERQRRMYFIIADVHESPLELAVRRDRFSAKSFSHAIAADARRGTVAIHPEGRILHVGSEPDCYERVRIFSDTGFLNAVMSVRADGRVIWSDPMVPSTQAGRGS